ncbi:hypothetical protein STEG23_031031, partial [Scotinomys teguina]
HSSFLKQAENVSLAYARHPGSKMYILANIRNSKRVPTFQKINSYDREGESNKGKRMMDGSKAMDSTTKARGTGAEIAETKRVITAISQSPLTGEGSSGIGQMVWPCEAKAFIRLSGAAISKPNYGQLGKSMVNVFLPVGISSKPMKSSKVIMTDGGEQPRTTSGLGLTYHEAPLNNHPGWSTTDVTHLCTLRRHSSGTLETDVLWWKDQEGQGKECL